MELLLPLRRPSRTPIRRFLPSLASRSRPSDRAIFNPFSYERFHPYALPTNPVEPRSRILAMRDNKHKRPPAPTSDADIRDQDWMAGLQLIANKCTRDGLQIGFRQLNNALRLMLTSRKPFIDILNDPDVRLTGQDIIKVGIEIVRMLNGNRLGWWIITCASDLGEAGREATLYAVAEELSERDLSVRRGGMKRSAIEKARLNLLELARGGDKQALCLFAKLKERDQDLRLAQKYYNIAWEEGREVDCSPLLREVLAPLFVQNLWIEVASLRARLGDAQGAKVAVEKAARRENDAEAYYYLAVQFEEPDSDNCRDYLLKSAQADYPQAAAELGIYYIRQSQILRSEKWTIPARDGPPRTSLGWSVRDNGALGNISDDPVRQKLVEGAEWLRKAAEIDGSRDRGQTLVSHGPYQKLPANILLAQVLRSIAVRDGRKVQEGDEGWRYLVREDENPMWKDEVEAIKETWYALEPSHNPEMLLGLLPSEVEAEVEFSKQLLREKMEPREWP